MVHFVGAGPGAPDLITVRGRNLLSAADVVIYAGSLVNPAILSMTKEDCRIFDSAHMTLPEILAELQKAENAGLTSVRLHSGDPSVYGAVREQMRELDRLGIPYDVTPGVTAFCAAAASLKTELTIPGGSQSVTITRAGGRTPVPERESIRSYAAHRAVLALYLSAARGEEVQRELLAGGYPEKTPVSVVYKASWPEEKIIRSDVRGFPARMREAGIEQTALILVGDAVGRGSGDDARSRLYSPDFTTGVREAEKKRFVLFGCSEKGCALMKRAAALLQDKEPSAEITAVVKASGVKGCREESIVDLTGHCFREADLLVFFAAAGIAVRAIAPFVRSKAEDPAVVSVDETGRFCISLLSGHLGRANAYARELADLLGAEPVITTATDLEGRFAVDLFALSHGFRIPETGKIKGISSAVLRGEVIPFYADPLIRIRKLPRELRAVKDRAKALLILSCFKSPDDRTEALHLVPPAVCLGIGCRKGEGEAEIRDAVQEVLRRVGIYPEAVAGIGSAALKQDEAGLLACASHAGLPVRFFSAERMNSLSGTFSASEFVRQTAGTDCVCERAAVLLAGRTDASALILRKTVSGHVTVAAAMKELEIS